MDRERVVAELESLYPGKNILQLPSDNPREIVCETDPTTDHSDKSVAIAVIDISAPHVHQKSTEVYRVLRGEVNLYVGKDRVILKEGDSFKIEPGNIHWASADGAWVEATSTPGWTPEDHILTD